ncbi:MAG: DUF448 domain-containing protein [Byssovorax sp.]
MTQREPRAHGRGEDAVLLRDPKGPVRSCVGCGERVDLGAVPGALVRLVLASSSDVREVGEVIVGEGRGEPGRGAHVHPRPACVRAAAEKGLHRSARRRVQLLRAGGAPRPLTAAALGEAIALAEDARVRGLLVAAARAGALSAGVDAASEAASSGRASLLLVAADAPEAAALPAVVSAIAAGRAVSWGTKALPRRAARRDREPAAGRGASGSRYARRHHPLRRRPARRCPAGRCGSVPGLPRRLRRRARPRVGSGRARLATRPGRWIGGRAGGAREIF